MKLKFIGVFFAGIFLGVFATIGSVFVASHLFMAELEENVPPDINLESDQLHRSSADIAKAKDNYEKYIALGNVALWQAASGMPELAAMNAKELLELAEDYKNDWNYSNALHKAHSSLGLIALKGGDIPEAISHLGKAGAVAGSPQLNSFGPNMYLARELLKIGERQAVISYLDSVENFWSLDMGRLKKWRSMIDQGQVPSFAAHLGY